MSDAMRRLGWSRGKLRFGGDYPQNCYWRGKGDTLKAATDDREIADLGCSLHAAVGRKPWDHVSVDDVVAYMEDEGKPRAK